MATEIKDLSETATAPASTGRIPWQNTDGTYGSATPAQIVTVGGGGGAGSGDVVGPASSTNGNLASFGDETGKLIADASIAAANVVTAAANLTNGNVVTGNGSKGLAAGSVAASALLVKTATVETVSGTSYEVTATDNGKILYFTSVSGCEVTLDADATVGVNVMLIPAATAGDIDIVQDTSATILNPAGAALTITGSGSASAVVVVNATSGEAVWSVGGDVAATV